jgi:hypothetical protein
MGAGIQVYMDVSGSVRANLDAGYPCRHDGLLRALPKFIYRKENSMTPHRDRGIIDMPSNHSVDETVEKLKGIMQAKGITLFALVNHSGEAEKSGNENASDQAADFREPKRRELP